MPQTRQDGSAESVVDLYEKLSRLPSSASSMTLFGESAVATYRALCVGVTAEEIASAVRRRLEEAGATGVRSSGVMYRTALAVTFHAATGQALATVPGDLMGTRLTPRTLQTLIAFGFQNGLTAQTRRLISSAANMQSLVDALTEQKQQRGSVARQRRESASEVINLPTQMLTSALGALRAVRNVDLEDATTRQVLRDLQMEVTRLALPR